jgi:hypothetical protein
MFLRMPSPASSPRDFIDDLPSLSVSRLVAEGKIARDAARVRIHLEGVSGEFAVSRIDFPNGGWWAFPTCYCGRRVRSLWVHDGLIYCRHCLLRLGLRYRCRSGDVGPRIKRLRARLDSPIPARLHPRPNRVLDRRWRLEACCGGRSLLSGCGVCSRCGGHWMGAKAGVFPFSISASACSGELPWA